MGVRRTKPKVVCPRCQRKVAATEYDPVSTPTPTRHKSATDVWCSGVPKTRGELTIDLAEALHAEHDALRAYSSELIDHASRVVELMGRHAEAQEHTIQIMNEINTRFGPK